MASIIKYGIDIKTGINTGEDPWQPVMLNSLARMKFESIEALFRYLDALKATNSQLETRIVEVFDHDPSYSV